MPSSKTIVLGVSGGIAAYKVCDLVRRLRKDQCDVHVVMTRHAQEFVTPLTFQALSQNVVHTDNFELSQEMKIDHISLADRADVLVIAPATANVIAKIAHGICDDLLTTVVCATQAPIVMVPSMNVHMWNNPITQENVNKLKKLGILFVDPTSGDLACGCRGKGRLAETQDILEAIHRATKSKKK